MTIQRPINRRTVLKACGVGAGTLLLSTPATADSNWTCYIRQNDLAVDVIHLNKPFFLQNLRGYVTHACELSGYSVWIVYLEDGVPLNHLYRVGATLPDPEGLDIYDTGTVDTIDDSITLYQFVDSRVECEFYIGGVNGSMYVMTAETAPRSTAPGQSGEAPGQNRVEICHSGKTISVPPGVADQEVERGKAEYGPCVVS